MPTKTNIEDIVRINSAKGKIFLALKDGKKHSFASVKAMLQKSGYEHTYGNAYALGRLLRANMGKTVVLDRTTKTFQMVPFSKPASKRPAKKAVAKKAAPKSAPKKEAVAA